jgi:hypothetical protein
MNHNTIDTAMARQMVDAAAIQGASIIGQPGGWSVMLKLGTLEKPLGSQRGDTPRTWRSLDRCVDYLRTELHIARVDLDATNFSEAIVGKVREDASARLRQAHEAATHDKWFRAQVELGLQEAEAPDAEWISNEDANASWATKRSKLAKLAEGSAG